MVRRTYATHHTRGNTLKCISYFTKVGCPSVPNKFLRSEVTICFSSSLQKFINIWQSWPEPSKKRIYFSVLIFNLIMIIQNAKSKNKRTQNFLYNEAPARSLLRLPPTNVVYRYWSWGDRSGNIMEEKSVPTLHEQFRSIYNIVLWTTHHTKENSKLLSSRNRIETCTNLNELLYRRSYQGFWNHSFVL